MCPTSCKGYTYAGGWWCIRFVVCPSCAMLFLFTRYVGCGLWEVLLGHSKLFFFFSARCFSRYNTTVTYNYPLYPVGRHKIKKTRTPLETHPVCNEPNPKINSVNGPILIPSRPLERPNTKYSSSGLSLVPVTGRSVIGTVWHSAQMGFTFCSFSVLCSSCLFPLGVFLTILVIFLHFLA